LSRDPDFYSYRLIETDRFFAVSGVQFPQTDRGLFHYHHTAFSDHLKNKVGLGLGKETDLRITFNLDGSPIISKSHTHPSHSQTSRLLTSSLSLGITCETLSTAHIDVHHQCWRLIHGELARLAAPGWKFLCVSGEKCLQTIWDEITSDFEDVQYLNLTQETIWNAVPAREMAHPLTPVEWRKIKKGIPRETIMKESFWRMRSDGIAVLPPAGNKTGTFCILEHKRMSDCCEHYLVRTKKTAENQYDSLYSAISTMIQRQGWKVDQVSFITGARSIDKQDFRNNLKFFGVPEASISSIYSKLNENIRCIREYSQMHV
jgi:hypothetical protein